MQSNSEVVLEREHDTVVLASCEANGVHRDAVETDAVKVQLPWKHRTSKRAAKVPEEPSNIQEEWSTLEARTVVMSSSPGRTVPGIEEFLDTFHRNQKNGAPVQMASEERTVVSPPKSPEYIEPGVSDSPTQSIEQGVFRCKQPNAPGLPTMTVVGQTYFEGVAASARDDEEYNMNHANRGLAVIFNHFKFKDPLKHKDRVGSDVDVKDLTRTLGMLGFEVIVHHDLLYVDIMTELKRVSRLSHADNDCLMVVVMTHGHENGKLLAYDVAYNARTLWHHFLADNCIELAGKPKLFVVQACRGDKEEKVVKLHRPRTETDGTCMSARDVSYTIPCNADFLFANSTVEGFAAFRDYGSWFIRSLCRELRGAGNTDLMKILTRTARRVAISYQTKAIDNPSRVIYTDPISKKQLQEFECYTQQMPSFYSTLTRDVYFKLKSKSKSLTNEQWL